MSASKSRKKKPEYTEEDFAETVAMVNREIRVRAASKACGVPRATLHDRIAGTHRSKKGRPPVLSEEEELIVKDMALLLADWGFPFNRMDLRVFVRSYLDKKGVVTRFKNNFPTKRFADTFIARHPDLKVRNTNPIKRSRAAVSREMAMEFFNNFQKCAEGVPPENLFNFDETCMRDDPGRKKCIFRKGTKHCELVMNSSKSNISVMFCGSAAGYMLPPMIVYKVPVHIQTYKICYRYRTGTIS